MKKLLLSILFLSQACSAANYFRTDNTIVKSTESIGSNAAANSKSLLELTSTTKGLLPPRMSTAQKNAITSVPEALMVYDSTTHYPNYYNGSAFLQLASLSGTETFTNKTLTGNTAANLISGSGTVTLNTSGTVTLPNATDTLVGKATTDTLTNKTIDADGTGNSITNIENADIKAAAAIALNKLAATTVSRALVSDGSGFVSPATTTSTEIGYVNGVTSAIQTQLDAKVAKSTYTAKGSLLAASAASTPANVAVGADGTVLTADSSASTGVAWASASSSANTLSINTQTANYTATTSDDMIMISGGVYTVTLYTAVGHSGKQLIIEKTDSAASGNYITIDGAGTETVGGDLVQKIGAQYEHFKIVADGANWQILEHYLPSGLMGSGAIALNASCAGWTRTNTALGAFATDTDCTGPVVEINNGPALLQTTDADLPQFTYNQVTPGDYRVIITGPVFTEGATSTVCLAINDGTSTSGRTCVNQVAGQASGQVIVEGTFHYATYQSSITFALWGSATTSSVNVRNSTGQEQLRVSLERL